MDEKKLFQMALNLSDPPWYVVSIDFDQPAGRIDIHINFRSGSRFLCPECSSGCPVHDTIKREWRHLNFFQYRAYIRAREPRIKCHEHGIKGVNVPWARKGSGFPLSFEEMVTMLSQEMPVSAVAKIVQIQGDSVWRILKHYVDEARKDQDHSGISVLGIDEFSVEKHHVYATLFYDIKNSRVMHIEEGKESDLFMRFMQKNPFLDVKNIEHITMDMYPSYISG